MSVTASAFDPAVTSAAGDLWLESVDPASTFSPVLIMPGATATIKVTIKPDASLVGKTVSGFLYVDTFNTTVLSGDEVVQIPYSFKVVR